MKFKFILILFIFLFSILGAFASIKVELEEGTAIIINGDKVIQFRASANGLNPQDRASVTAFELIQLANNGYLTDNFTLIPKDEICPYYTIAINGNPICIVTDEDGAAINSTAEGLAKVWINNIRKALQKQSIYMIEKQATIPIDEKRTKNVYGYNISDIKITVLNPEICSVNYDSELQTLDIYGKSLGQTDIILDNGQDTLTYTVYVQKYAAVFPTEIKAEVTGNPISADLVSEAMQKNISKGIITEPGANYKVNKITWTKKALYPEQETGADVNITAYGDNYITVTQSVRFVVKNINMPQGVPDTLLYSNNPETFTSFGDLFVGHIAKGECNRLLYHHMNKTGRNAFVVVEIINPNPEAIELRVRKGVAKPQLDTIAIGLVAAKQYMLADEDNVSVIESIPANSRSCYVADDLKNNISSSGIIQFWQLSGEQNCLVRVRAVAPEDIDCSLNKIRPYMGTGDFELSDFTFLKPQIEINEEYKIGGPWVFMPIGKFHLENEKHLKLYGNYGVSYICNVNIENPTDKKAKVRVYIDPTAGSMAAFLKINDEYKTIHHVKPPNEYELAEYTLEPGDKRFVQIKTIPISGSNYPCKFCVGQKLADNKIDLDNEK